MGFEPLGSYVTCGLSLFKNLRFGTTKDKIFVCSFTLEKCHSQRIQVFLLGEGMEVVTSQQDRDLTGAGQLAVSCAHPPVDRQLDVGEVHHGFILW